MSTDFNTGTICLYASGDGYDETPATLTVRTYRDGVYLSAKADPKTPLVGITLNSDEAQALIANLQAALNAHWGNV